MNSRFRRVSIVAGGTCVLALWAVIFTAVEVPAQIDNAPAADLVVGLIEAPPFMMKTENGRWEGLSIELWQELAQILAVDFQWREYDSFDEIRSALAAGQVDAVPGMAITEEHEILFDFSHPYYESGSAIAVSTAGTDHTWLGVAQHLLTWGTLRALGVLALLWVFAGVALWLCERHHHDRMIADGPMKSLEHGIWWAVVTMTTVGYGDIAPKTFAGRMVAVTWMLASLVLIASFTASITAALTVGALDSRIRGLNDLRGVRVGSLAQSESLEFLTEHEIAVAPMASSRAGLVAVIDNELDAFVFDRAVLAYLARTEFPDRIKTIHGVFNPYYLGVALAPGSALQEPINRALLRITHLESWSRWTARYLGAGN
jgi:polar amino acid transport system substrate-binding protein